MRLVESQTTPPVRAVVERRQSLKSVPSKPANNAEIETPIASGGLGPSIVVSMVLHLALLGTFAAVGGFDTAVVSESPPEATWQESDFGGPASILSEPIASMASLTLDGLPDPSVPILDIPSPTPSMEPGGGQGVNLPGRSTAGADLQAAMGRGIDGLGTGAGEGVGAGGGGRGFFARGSSGKRIVYVVDASQSMNHPHPGPGKTRLGRVKLELVNSIRALSPTQKFFIVFFNDGPIPMPADRMMEGNDAAKLHYLRWMVNVPGDGHTEPALALLMALKLNPDTIYFLTDGDFRPTIVKEVAVTNRRGVKIHTIGFTQDRGEKLLRTIAEQNGGTYLYVPPDEGTAEVAESPTTTTAAKP